VGGASEISKTISTVLEGFLITMILNIFSDHFGYSLATSGTGKISVFPKFTIPPVLLILWTLAKNHPPAITSHCPRRAISRWKQQKSMHMIQDNLEVTI